MIKSWLANLNAKPQEQGQIALMLTTGFFMGTFIATYTVTAESLFLNQLSGELNKAFLFAGVLGVISTVLFSFFQARVKFSNLVIFSLLLIIAFVSVVYGLYKWGDPSYHDEVLFSMYCLTGPMTAILLLCYWGIFGRLFNFKQSKRIIGWIDTGQLIASILAFFFIPLTVGFLSDTSDFLLACNVSIAGALTCLVIISARYPLAKNDPAEFDETVRQETSFGKVLSDKYTLLMGVFLVISMATYVFSQFSFQTLINQQYTSERELTNFLAYFNGAIYALSLVMQTFVNDKILSNYGIRVSLFILPALVGIFAVASTLIAIFLGFDQVTSPETFIFFFLSVALMRLFNAMIKDSLENPVFKLLFIPMDSRYRFGIQAKLEGAVNEFGRFVAGAILFGLALIPLFKVYWIPVFILVLAAVYFFVVRNLYNGYRTKIRAKLESSELNQDRLEIGYASVTARLESRLESYDASQAVFALKLLEKINPAKLSLWVNNLMNNQQAEAQDYAQRRLNELKGLSVSDRYVIKVDGGRTEAGDRNVLSKSDLEMVIRSGGDITKNRVQRLSRSHRVEDRQYAAELLLHSQAEDNVSYLIELLNDPEPKVRHTAIKTAIKKHNNEVILALIENLPNPLYGNQALNALTLIGGKALTILDSAFYRSGQHTQTMLKIVQIMGRIGGQRAKDLLWNKIDYPDKVIVSQVLLSLGECGFKAGISQITRIKYAIESDIADISWNLSAIQEIGNEGHSDEVKAALRREIQNDIEHIYMLLAMLYDTRSIQLVKENIESGTTEGTTYAVELLDVFLSEQLKQRVIPVLDELSDQERVSRLEVFYPRVKLDGKLVLKFLINRDFTQSNRWTKATVLYQIGTLKIQEFKLDLIAQMFNPDRLIKEVSAWALYQIFPDEYHANARRLGEAVKKELDEAILAGQQTKLMLFEKVLFFKDIPLLTGTPGIALSHLADISEETRLNAQASVSVDEKLNNYFYLVYSGALEYYSKGKLQAEYGRGQFIGEMLAAPGFANANVLVAKEDTRLLAFNKDLFYELLAGNIRLTDRVLETI
ncbi:MAG: cyclic nucleotide-binding domain-containing protein [Bacteroidota bacterium]